MTNRFFLDPFGCVKNQVDAETMMAFLGEAGWEQAESPEAADLIIVNSCGFIESAKRESLDAVFSYRTSYPEKKILLAGCLSQRYAKELEEDLPEADLLFGNKDLSRIADAAARAMEGGGRALMPESPAVQDNAAGPNSSADTRTPGDAGGSADTGCQIMPARSARENARCFPCPVRRM